MSNYGQPGYLFILVAMTILHVKAGEAIQNITISKPEVIVWPSNPEDRANITPLQLTCTNMEKHDTCSWILPFHSSGEKCRPNKNCEDLGIQVSDNVTSCSISTDVNKAENLTNFTGKWQCNLELDNEKKPFTASTFVHIVSDENLRPELTSENFPGKAEFTCHFQPSAPQNVLTWSLNGKMKKTETYDASSSPVSTSKYSLALDKTHFGSTIACHISKRNYNGQVLSFQTKNNGLVKLEAKEEKEFRFKFLPKVIANITDLNTTTVIMESWPLVTFGTLKLEIFENTSEDHTNPVLTDLVRETMNFYCNNSSEKCRIESKNNKIILAIVNEKLNETVTKMTFSFDNSFLSNGYNLLNLQFGQLGQENEDKPELFDMEIILPTSNTEGKLSSETDLMSSSANPTLTLVILSLLLVIVVVVTLFILNRHRQKIGFWFQRGVFEVPDIEDNKHLNENGVEKGLLVKRDQEKEPDKVCPAVRYEIFDTEL